MRSNVYLALASTVLLAGSAFGASKEELQMQRDIAQLQDQVRTLQSSMDQKLAVVQTLIQQALDSASKANTSVTVLNDGVNQTLQRELRQALIPVAGLAAKVDNTNNDVAELRTNVQDLTRSINRIQQGLGDLSNAIKVMQATPAPPPQPTAQALFTSAQRDYTGGNYDMAASEYEQALKLYPDDPNAPAAQLNLCLTYFAAKKRDQAVDACDTVITKYPDDEAVAPQAYFTKGMAQVKVSKAEAKRTWQTLVAKFPHSDAATKAKQEARAVGIVLAAATPVRRKR
ncbi:MAG: outer membrane protein assembly factor BamD [Acidobacteriota bacterium]|nr:outer membrane protein assembly factor BamD [Acidobacteriota bacterium]